MASLIFASWLIGLVTLGSITTHAAPAINVTAVFTPAEAGRMHMDVGGVYDGTSNIAPSRGDQFSATYTNTGADPALAFVPTVTVPVGMSFASSGAAHSVTLTGPSPECDGPLPSNSFNPGDFTGQTLTVSFIPSFDLPAGCAVDVSVEVMVDAGQISQTLEVTHSTAFKNASDVLLSAEAATSVLVLAGGLLVDKVLASGQSEDVTVNSTANFEIAVTNAGSGRVFNVEVEDIDTDELSFLGFTLPGNAGASAEGKIVSFDSIGSDQTFLVGVQSSVNACSNLINIATGTEPGGLVSTGQQSLKLDLETPLIDVDFDPSYQLSFSTPTQITFEVKSTGRGVAKDVRIALGLPGDVEFGGVVSGPWTYESGDLVYTPKNLAEDVTTSVTFELSPREFCTPGAGGFATLLASYTDACENPYAVPSDIFEVLTVQDEPTATIVKTVSKNRFESGELGSFTLSPTVTNADQLNDTVTVTDTLPDTVASIGTIIAPIGTQFSCGANGTACQPGDELTWIIDLSALGDTLPNLNVPFTTFANACTGGTTLLNTAEIAAQSRLPDPSGGGFCQYNDSDSAVAIITNSIGNDTNQSFNVDTATMISGGFETGTASTDNATREDPSEGAFIPLSASYVFGNQTGVWATATFDDNFGGSVVAPHQQLVADTLEVAAYPTLGGSAVWQAVPAGSFSTSAEGLNVDLGFVEAAFGLGENVADTTLEIRYKTTVADGALDDAVERRFQQFATLTLQMGGGNMCGDNGDATFTSGAFISIQRAAAQATLDMPNVVNACEPFDLTLTVDDLRADGVDVRDIEATLELGDTFYQPVDGSTPNYSGYFTSGTTTAGSGDNRTFSNNNEMLGPLKTGSVALRVLRKPNLDTGGNPTLTTFNGSPTDATATVRYQDNQGTEFDTSGSAQPVVVNAPKLVLTVTPQEQLLSGNVTNWTIFVTNTGAAPSVNTQITQLLSPNLIADVAAMNAVNPGSLTVSGSQLTWDVAPIAPGTSIELRVFVTLTTGALCEAFQNQENDIGARWGCANVFVPAETRTSPKFVFPFADLDVAHDTTLIDCPLCGTGTVGFILTNTGKRSLFNVTAEETVGEGFTLLASGGDNYEYSLNGTSWTSFNPVGTAATGDTSFSVDSSTIPQLAELVRVNDANGTDTFHRVYVRYKVMVDEAAAQSIAGPTVSLQASAEVTCGDDITAQSTDNIEIKTPEITLNKTGANMSVEGVSDPSSGALTYRKTTYGVPGDTIVWRMEIENTGDVAAENVRLDDLLPFGGANQSVDAISSVCTLNGQATSTSYPVSSLPVFALDNLDVGEACSVYLTVTMGETLCGTGDNTATASYGCMSNGASVASNLPDLDGSGLDPTGLHTDSASLVLVPNFSNGNAITQTFEDRAGGVKRVTVRVRNKGSRTKLTTLTNTFPTNMVLLGDVVFDDGNSDFTAAPAIVQSADSFTATFADQQLGFNDYIQFIFDLGPDGHADAASAGAVNPETDGNSLDPTPPANGTNLVDLVFDPGCGTLMDADDSATVQLATPDLDFTVVPDNRAVQLGDLVNFDFEITQMGEAGSIAGHSTDPSSNPITFVPTLGAGWNAGTMQVTLLSSSGATAAICAVSGCTVEQLTAGGVVKVRVSAEVGNTTQPLTVDAVVTGPYDDTSNYSLDAAQVAAFGFTFDKALTGSDQSSTSDAEMLVGEIQTWTLSGSVFGLTSGQTTDTITLTDLLPAGLGYVSSSSTGDLLATLTNGPTPINSGTLTFDIANTTATETTFAIEVQTQVLDVSATQVASTLTDTGETLTNTAALAVQVFDETFDNSDNPALSDSVDISVKRPKLELKKSVRKQGGTFADIATGDAGDTFEYELEITNSGSAPVFSLSVTDLFDDALSDIEVASGSLGLAGGITFGDIAVVSGANELTWSESSTNRPAVMEQMDAGETIRLVYSATTKLAVMPNEVLGNRASITGDTLPDPDPNNNHATLTASDSAEVMVLDAAGMTKQITRVSQSAPTSSGAPQQLVVGEQVEFQLAIVLPEGTTGQLIFRDKFPANLALVAEPTAQYGSAIANGSCTMLPPPGALPINGAADLDFTFANCEVATNRTAEDRTISVTYVAQALNISANQSGAAFKNAAAFTTDPAMGNLSTPIEVAMFIAEPQLSLTKTVSPTTGVDAGDEVTYTFEVENTGNATAHNVVLTDSLPTGLVFTTATASDQGSVTAPPPVYSDDDQTLTVSTAAGLSIPAGETLTVSVTATLTDAVQLNQSLVNSARITWTSLENRNEGLDDIDLGTPGSTTGTRNGTRDGTDADDPNDYTATGTAPLTVSKPSTFEKTVLTPPTNGTGFRVGDLVSYQIELSLMEGTTENLRIIDTLPSGLSIHQAGNVSAVAPLTFGDVAAPPVGATGAVTWDFGTVVNAGNTDDADDTLTVTYTAVIESAAGLEQTLTNTAEMRWDDGNDAAQKLESSVPIIVGQPELSLAKAVAEDGPDFYKAGDEVTFTLTLTNTGSAPAYGPVIQDVLPDGLNDTALPNGATEVGTTATTKTIDFDLSALEVPANGTYELSYSVTVNADVGPNFDMVNAASIDSYCSLPDGHAQQADRKCWEPDDTPVTAKITTKDIGGIAKTVDLDEIQVGQLVTYTIVVPANEDGEGEPAGVALYDLKITDALDSSLEIETVTIVDDQGLALGYTGTDTGSQLSVTLDDLLPADRFTKVTLSARLTAETTAQQLDNTASFTFASVIDGTPSVPRESNEVTTSIVEPDLTIAKAHAGTDARLVEYKVGDSVPFVLTILNRGDGVAYDTVIQDRLPEGLDDAGVANVTIQLVSAGGASSAVSPTPTATQSGATPNVITWTMTGEALAPDEQFVVSYDVTVDSDIGPVQTLSNTALVASYASDHDADNDDRRSYGPSDSDSVDVITPEVGGMTKTRDVSTANVGEVITYTITLPTNGDGVAVPAGAALFDVAVQDRLPAGLTLIDSTVKAVASDGTETVITATPSATTGAFSIDVGDLSADQYVVVTLSASVADVPTNSNDDPTSLVNEAGFTYAIEEGGDPIVGGEVSATPTTVTEPELSVVKTLTSGTSGELIRGDEVSYRLVVRNDGDGTGYGVEVIDRADIGLISPQITNGDDLLVSATGTEAANVAGGYADWMWALSDPLAPGASVTLDVTYSISETDLLTAGQALSNTALTAWRSTEGQNDETRSETAENETPVVVNLAGPRFSKSLAPDQTGPFAVGALVRYHLTFDAQNLAYDALKMVDTLADGMAYSSHRIVTAKNISTGQGGEVAEPSLSDAAPVLAFEFGAVQGTAADAQLVLEVVAYVVADPTNATDDKFVNKAAVTWIDEEDEPQQIVSTEQPEIAIALPVLALTKTLNSDTPGPFSAGDEATFDVKITNEGLVAAHEPVLIDTLPNGFDDVAPTLMTLDATQTFLAATDDDPATVAWAANAGVVIPAEGELTFSYTVTFDEDVAASVTLTNNLALTQVQTLSSEDPNADNAQTIELDLEDQAEVTTPGANSMAKLVDKIEAAIGDTVTYTFIVPGTAAGEPAPIGSQMSDVRVWDRLPEGLRLETVTATIGSDDDSSFTGTPTATGFDLVFGVVPPNEVLTVTAVAVVTDLAALETGFELMNNAQFSYASEAGGDPVGEFPSNEVTTSIVEPDLTIAKALDSADTFTVASLSGSLGRGDTVQYLLAISNPGDVTAFDINVRDLADAGLTDLQIVGAKINDDAVSGTFPIAMTETADDWSWPSELSLEGGQTLEVTVAATIDPQADLSAGDALNNRAQVAWTSSVDNPEDARSYTSEETAPVEITLGGIAFEKTIAEGEGYELVDGETPLILPGTVVTYHLTVSGVNLDLPNLTIFDSVPPHMEYRGHKLVSADGLGTVASPAGPAADGSELAFEFGDLSGTDGLFELVLAVDLFVTYAPENGPDVTRTNTASAQIQKDGDDPIRTDESTVEIKLLPLCNDENKCLALDKAARDASQNAETGAWTVTFDLTAKNIGPIALDGFSLVDDVVDQLIEQGATSATIVADSLTHLVIDNPNDDTVVTLNTDFGGSSGSEDLLIPASATLGLDAGVKFSFAVTFDAAGQTEFENLATVGAELPNGDKITEDSTSGGEAGATPIQMPSIGLAKRLTSFLPVGGGFFEAGFEFAVVNYGNTLLTNVQVTDDVATQLYAQGVEPGSVSISQAPIVSEVTDAIDVALLSNGAVFTGIAGPGGNLLVGDEASTLPAGASAKITIKVKFQMLTTAQLQNSAQTTAKGPSGTWVADTSQDGDDADPNGDRNPLNNSDPTLMPIDPSGVVYDALNGVPVPGAIVTLLGSDGQPLPAVCLAPGQQDQVTGADGTYRLDVNVGLNAVCPATQTAYTLRVTPPSGYSFQSALVPPATNFSSVVQASFDESYDATNCPAPASYNGLVCEIVSSTTAPTGGVTQSSNNNLAQLTVTSDFHHFLTFSLQAGDPHVVNNHIPLDPAAAPGSFGLTKRVIEANASVGDLVNYELVAENLTSIPLSAVTLRDTPPAGFAYVATSASVTTGAMTANIDPVQSGSVLSWRFDTSNAAPLDVVAPGQKVTIRYKMTVGTRNDLGDYTNVAVVLNDSGTAVSDVAEATVRVGADPVFDCAELVGHVYYDRNRNGYQDDTELGVAKVRIGTMNGKTISTDTNGRYYLPCAAVPNVDRGSNFSLKVDTASLPSGYRVTSENPRVVRLTRGKMTKANFGVSVARIIAIELDDRAFQAGREQLTDAAAREIARIWAVMHQAGQAQIRIIYNLSDAEAALPISTGFGRASLAGPDLVERRLRSLSAALRDGWWTHPLNRDRQTKRWRLRKGNVEFEIVNRQTGQLLMGNVPSNLERRHTNRGDFDARPPVQLFFEGQSFDGPLDGRGDEMGQRWVDRALAGEDLQVRFDGLNLTRLLNVTTRVERGDTGRVIRFTPYWNYDAFIARAELHLFAGDSANPKAPTRIVPFDNAQPLQLPIDALTRGELGYVLRVYGHKGHFDETNLETIEIGDPQFDFDGTIRGNRDRPDFAGYGSANLAKTGIPINGGMLTVSGEKLEPGAVLSVGGKLVAVTPGGKFVTQQILPFGQHNVEIALVEPTRGPLQIRRQVLIKQNDLFYTVLADATFGANITDVDGAEEFDEQYAEGRLAFFLKGKVRGDVLITAMGDTGEGELKSLFTDLHETDPNSVLRRIDPDQHYPVYGDGSTVIDETNSDGKFYVRIERNNSFALLGNATSNLDQSRLLEFNQTLYGLKGHYEIGQTADGDPRASVTGFASTPDSAHVQDRLRGTGGSLYFLRQRDIIRGSEVVRIEVRDRNSDLLLTSVPLVAGEDYTVDSFQGRMILTKPLASTASTGSLFADSALDGHPLYLVVDYDYVPELGTDSSIVAGGEAGFWITNRLRLGVAGYKRETGNDDHTAISANVIFKPLPDVTVTLEAAQTDGVGQGYNNSDDGGFNFAQVAPVQSQQARALAADVEADLASLTSGRVEGMLNAYYRDLEAGFHGRGADASNDLVKYGADADVKISERMSIGGAFDQTHNSNGTDSHTAEVTATYAVTGQVSATLGASRTDSGTTVKEEIGGKLSFDDPETGRSAYIFGTTNVDGKDHRYGVGGTLKVTDRLSVGAEVSNSSVDGWSAKVNGQYAWSDTGSIYSSYDLRESTSGGTDGAGSDSFGGQLTVGARQNFGRFSVYGEERLSHQSNQATGLMHAMGVDYAPFESVKIGLSGEFGKIDDVEREAVSASASYNDPRLSARVAGEYRNDEQANGDVREQIAAFAKVNLKLDEAFTLKSHLNYSASETNLNDSGFDDSLFIEGSVGLAYRPIDNDRFNGLVRYTYLHDLPPADQVNASGSTTDFKQESHLFSADGTLRIGNHLDVGAKYGVKLGRQTATRTDDTWFENETHLGVLRADVHFVHEWDALIEGRALYIPRADDMKIGGLAAIYRHLGENAKIGVGVNVSDFSDNLANPAENKRGVFINMIGKF